jgi:hypothetical protein
VDTTAWPPQSQPQSQMRLPNRLVPKSLRTIRRPSPFWCCPTRIWNFLGHGPARCLFLAIFHYYGESQAQVPKKSIQPATIADHGKGTRPYLRSANAPGLVPDGLTLKPSHRRWTLNSTRTIQQTARNCAEQFSILSPGEKCEGVEATFQPLILKDEGSGLQTRIAATGSVSLCV